MEKEALQEPIEVKAEPAQKKITYTTKLEFHDKDKGKRVETSVVAPSVTQSGMLAFLTEECLINYPLAGIFRFETKQIVHDEPSKLVI